MSTLSKNTQNYLKMLLDKKNHKNYKPKKSKVITRNSYRCRSKLKSTKLKRGKPGKKNHKQKSKKSEKKIIIETLDNVKPSLLSCRL